jgi:hypothetical protein
MTTSATLALLDVAAGSSDDALERAVARFGSDGR